jgi:2,4-dienoyl-CoA reductase-like NADH-dependent reductase (Old Yellow Enzyme family)
VLDVVDAVVDVWGPGAVGIKLCPCDDVSDIAAPYHEISETYSYLIQQLVARELGFIELMRRGCNLGNDNDGFSDSTPRPVGTELPLGYEPLDEFGPLIKYPGSKTMLMVNYGYTVEEAESLVKQGRIDLVSFGRPFIYNPVCLQQLLKACLTDLGPFKDLISRVKNGIAFATNDRGIQVNYGPYDDPNENYNDWSSAP